MKIFKKYTRDYNYILQTAKTAANQAADLRNKQEIIDDNIRALDELEEACLEALKTLAGKDYRAFAMEKNYDRKK